MSALCVALADRVGTDRFELWFHVGTTLRMVDRTLVVATAEQFRLETLRRQFRLDLLAVATEQLGYEPALKFELDPSLGEVSEPDANEPPPAPAAAPQVIPSTAPVEPAPGVFARRTFSTLPTFVVGDGNRLAHSAALSVLARPGMYSPLLLHGPTGSGKSHLLQGIWCQAQKSRELRVLYLTAEQFTSQFIEALKGSGLPSFRRKIRDTQLLLIDDVQFFAGKQSTLVELQHTIDTLLRDGRQLVFAADRSPAELRGLGPELIARLGGGLPCALESADYPTRLGILRQLAERQQVEISSEVLNWLASQLAGDARQLAGAMNRLEATSRALDEPITLPFAQTALTDLLRAGRRAVRLPDIDGAVCDVFGLDRDRLHSGSKSPGITHPRMLAMFLARKYTRAALSEIGQYYGRKSHSTVFSAEGKVQEWLAIGKTLHVSHGECSVADALRRVEAQLRLG